MTSYYFHLFSLSDGGHLGIVYKNETQTPNYYLIWNPRYQVYRKNVFIQGYWCPGSKLHFSKWGWRPSLILASGKNCQDFWEGHGG